MRSAGSYCEEPASIQLRKRSTCSLGQAPSDGTRPSAGRSPWSPSSTPASATVDQSANRGRRQLRLRQEACRRAFGNQLGNVVLGARGDQDDGCLGAETVLNEAPCKVETALLQPTLTAVPASGKWIWVLAAKTATNEPANLGATCFYVSAKASPTTCAKPGSLTACTGISASNCRRPRAHHLLTGWAAPPFRPRSAPMASSFARALTESSVSPTSRGLFANGCRQTQSMPSSQALTTLSS